MKFRTVSSVISRHKNILLREMEAVLHLYRTKGFQITSINADKEFACLREEVRPMELDIYPTEDHAHEVERSIHNVKERI